MQDFVSGFPKTDALKRGLAAALQSEDVGACSLTLLGREATPYATTFPCEIVTCRIGRTVDFAGPRYRKSSWLRDLHAHAEDFLSLLLTSAPAVIHGEYYQHNILFHRGHICPIDWESAAVGEGLIDLACLTDGWESKIADVCKTTYVRTRWPQGVAADFERGLKASRLYMTVRWLGADPAVTRDTDARGYWTQLQDLVTELGRL